MISSVVLSVKSCRIWWLIQTRRSWMKRKQAARCSVQLDQQLLLQAELPERRHEAHPLLGHLTGVFIGVSETKGT